MNTRPEIKALFDRIVTGGHEFLQQMVSDQTPESFHLEFKTFERSDGTLSISDKRHLSKSISGFANAEGGILLCGVETASGSDGDLASSFKPVQNVASVASSIRESTPDLYAPGVISVQIESIVADESGRGVIAIYVPATDGLPIMATATKEQRYYRRVGTSTRPMDHSMLADMFGRRPQPVLQLRVHPIQIAIENEVTDSPTGINLHFGISLYNAGRGIAHWPACNLEIHGRQIEYAPPGCYADHFHVHESNEVWPSSCRFAAIIASDGTRVVYPNGRIDIFAFNTLGRLDGKYQESIRIKYVLHAEGFRDEGEGEISGEYIESQINEYRRMKGMETVPPD